MDGIPFTLAASMKTYCLNHAMFRQSGKIETGHVCITDSPHI